MKKLLPLLLLVTLSAFEGSHSCFAQQPNLDSLWGVWEDKSQPDTNRLDAMKRIAWYGYIYTAPDSSIYFAQQLLELAESIEHRKFVADALNIQGSAYRLLGEFDKAIEYHQRSFDIMEEIDDKSGMAAAVNNIGIVHVMQGDRNKALDYFKQNLAIREKIGDKRGIAGASNNIGNLYRAQGNLAKAAEYMTRALKIFEELGDDRAAEALLNIGMLYSEQDENAKAMEFYLKSLELFRKQGNISHEAKALLAVGYVQHETSNYKEAIDSFNESLELCREIGHKDVEVDVTGALGAAYQSLEDYDKALAYYRMSLNAADSIGFAEGSSQALCNMARIDIDWKSDYGAAIIKLNRAMTLANEIEEPDDIRDVSKVLYDAYKHLGKDEKALEMYELHIQMRDSIMSEENQREVLRQEYKYEYEKEALADSLVFAKKEALSQAEIKRKNQQRNALMGGLGLISIFSGLLYNRFRVTRKQKQVIEIQKAEVEEQKEQVEHKNEEIMASITYAKKLQTAVLPPARVVKEFFANSFLLYLPRDIVSGDFYWMESHGDGSYFAVADCTGHGVPGAMLSVIGMNGLNRALNEQNLTEPKDILTSLSDHVQRHFEQSESTVRDGMDICLCALDNKTKKLTFSGANNPVWIARNGEMHILNGDRRAIGHHNTDTQFTQQEFQLEDGDVIYLSSDGYQDQLGGPKARKLMKKVFREKLLALSTEPLEAQREELLSYLELWQQGTPQTDDICVMGIRV